MPFPIMLKNYYFADFDRNTHKDLIFINIKGKLFKYHFNKKRNGKISPILSVQWF